MEAILFIGIQATGKSTLFLQRFFDTHVRINLDMLKTRHREMVLVEACLVGKQPFVVDNTNPAVEDRAPYIELARQHGFAVHGYYFQSKIEDALARNAARERSVPERGLLGCYGRLVIPSIVEGFDSLHYVTASAVGFEISAWQDDAEDETQQP